MEAIKRVYIDVMVGGRFYRQLPYNVIGGGNITIPTLQKYVCEKLPTLRNKPFRMSLSDCRV